MNAIQLSILFPSPKRYYIRPWIRGTRCPGKLTFPTNTPGAITWTYMRIRGHSELPNQNQVSHPQHTVHMHILFDLVNRSKWIEPQSFHHITSSFLDIHADYSTTVMDMHTIHNACNLCISRAHFNFHYA